MNLSTEMKMYYRIKQYIVDGAIRRSDSIHAIAPERWRTVDNRDAYTKKRMKMDDLL